MTKKSNAPDAVLRKGDLPKAEQVVDAKPVENLVRKAINAQLMSDQVPGTNSSPKARRTNYWGIGSKK